MDELDRSFCATVCRVGTGNPPVLYNTALVRRFATLHDPLFQVASRDPTDETCAGHLQTLVRAAAAYELEVSYDAVAIVDGTGATSGYRVWIVIRAVGNAALLGPRE